MEEIFAPALGMASTEVVLSEWLVAEGEAVVEGQIIAMIETDKSELELAAPRSGTIGRLRYQAGDAVPNGATIATILDADESEASPAVGTAPDAATTPVRPTAPVAGEPFPAADAFPAGRGAGARERDDAGDLLPHTLSPRERSGLGSVGAAAASVAAAPEAPPSTTPEPVPGAVPDKHRRAVAAAVTRSWAEIPHFAATAQLDVAPLEALLRSARAVAPGITFTDLIVKAYALSLVGRLGVSTINLSLAVATDAGVAMPVLENVAEVSLLDLSKKRAAAVQRAREGKSAPEDLLPGHSAVSNLGGYGVEHFTGIIPVGQTSLLTIGAAADRPVVRDGQLVAGRTMYATLNVDHREWDGQHVGEVLQRLAALSADPAAIRVV